MPELPSILVVNDLHISFHDGKITADPVKGVSFILDRGKTLAVVGESGSGKSLTAMALAGLLPKNAQVKGKLQFHASGHSFDLGNLSDKEWRMIRSKDTGIIFQEPMSSLNPVMKIGKQLMEAIASSAKISADESRSAAVSWLERVKLPTPEKIFNRYPHQLSGGQKQRIMIAMAMCKSPALLIADEPTTALDVTVQQEILKLMQELQQQSDTAMIFITHDLPLAATIADEVLVMYQGAVMEYGNANQVLQYPQHPYTKALLACKPSVGNKGKKLPTVADFLDVKEDLSFAAFREDAPDKKDYPLLTVNNLSVWFEERHNWLGKPAGYFKAVEDVSFVLKKGEVLGLVGESGCGKSTLSRSLMGLLPVHSGQVIYKDKDIAGATAAEWRTLRKDIQLIFQDPYASLNPRMSIGDIIMEPMKVHGTVPHASLKNEMHRLLDIVHLPSDSYSRYPHQFSGGQRQRIGIARALALRPELIICDESVSALDVSVQAQILNLLKELQQELGLSYLFISHDLSVVHYISDRVMVMQSGNIVESGAAEQVLRHPQNAYTRRLVNAMP